MGRYDSAIADYTKAISIEPRDAGLLFVKRGLAWCGPSIGLVTSAAGLPSLTYSRTIRDDQNQL
jgi:hypothetical protein